LPVGPGQSLLQYRLVDKIGQGGMGVVWEAVDTNLERPAAIKVLPEAFYADANRLARFEREAKLLASLSHPGIASVYGLDEADGVRFLAMELVPGETLADRLERGPMPVDDALDVCRQIAEAVSAAHASGVLHRDLKPANAKITSQGKVKVLDFGLAKAFDPDPVSGSASAASPTLSPTLTSAGTVAGVILGTAAYMSPEQARAKPVDRRADVWAFGCILYELLTGRAAFLRETVSDTLALVLKGEPHWTALPADCPASIRRLLRRCLEKNRDRRLHDLADARIVIEDALSGEGDDETPGATPRRRGLGWPGVVLGVLVGAAVMLPFVWRSKPASTSRTVRLTLSTPADASFRPSTLQPFGSTFSPDGSSLVYTGWTTDGRSMLFVRPLGQSGARALDGTAGGSDPSFSPDGRWLAFSDGTAIKKIPADGGTPLELARPAHRNSRPTWVGDGSLVYLPIYTEGLVRIPESGGEPEALTTVDHEAGDFGHWWPHVPPGADYILYSRWKSTVDDCSVWKHSLRAQADEKLLDRACHPIYIGTGHLLFAREDSVMAMAFDVRRGTVSGSPTAVLDDVFIDPADGGVALSVSADGTLAYMADDRFGSRGTLAWIALDGGVGPLTSEVRDIRKVRVSPDGRYLALAIRQRTDEDIWIHDIERGSTRRFTLDGTNRGPVWMADSTTVVFSTLRLGPYDLFSKPIDGSRDEEPLFTSPYDQTAGSWSPDGQRLALTRNDPISDLWLFERGSEVQRLTETSFVEGEPFFSPDGRWIAYHSDASGRNEVYVMATPSGRGRWQVSVDGGLDPRWSPDGSTLYYSWKGIVYAASLETGPDVRAGRPRKLFDEERLGGVLLSYDIHPDGKRFVAVLGERQQSTPVNIVLNWFDEVRRRVPG